MYRYIILILILINTVSVIPATAQATASEDTLEFRLPWVSDAFLDSMYINLRESEVEFVREPEGISGNSVRGSLTDNRENPLGFLLDRKAGQIHIDANRNFDLTDDADAIIRFDSSERDGKGAVTIDCNGHALPCNLIISIFKKHGWTAIRSGWESEITIDGEPFLVGILDKLDGRLTEDDAFRMIPLNRADRKLIQSVPEQSLPSRIVIEKRLYRLEAEIDFSTSPPDAILRFFPVEDAPASLTLAGSHIISVALNDGKRNLRLVNPAETVPVPDGAWTAGHILLDNNFMSAYFPASGPEVTVPPGETAVFNIGAPLKQTAEVEFSGRKINLDFQLTGIGGESYKGIFLTTFDGRVPRFSIRKNGVEVLDDQFDYG